MLWFGFSATLVRYRWFSCCYVGVTLSQGLLGPSSPASVVAAGAQEGTQPASRTSLPKGLLQTMARPVQKLGDGWPGPLLGNQLGIGQRVLSSCAGITCSPYSN